MKVSLIIVGILLPATTLGAPGTGPITTFEEFKEENHELFLDPKEEAAAKEEFEKHEAQVEQNNADYEHGWSNFMEEVEPWDDETIEQFEEDNTGLIPIDDTVERGLGLILTPEHERINTPEEIAYFDELVAKYVRAGVPDTWDSRAKGWVSPVRNQGACGSCAAFAAVAAAESSLLKAGAAIDLLDISEQWMVDCKPPGAKGCKGASLVAYHNYMAQKGKFMHENDHPYKGSTEFQCPSGPYWSPGYKIIENPTAWNPTDEQIMAHVMEFGATTVAVYASDPGFNHYKSGVFDTCNNNKVNHGVAIVGWGTENNIPYWLIKNSWGANWGDNGFIKVKRGTCYINKYGSAAIAAVKTTGEADPLDPNQPTPAPSADCDMSKEFGPITGNKEFTFEGRKVKAICHNGKCMVPGAKNSCKAICGKDPCYSAQCFETGKYDGNVKKNGGIDIDVAVISNVGDPESCQKECVKNLECKFWTYNNEFAKWRGGRKKCWLQNANAPETKDTCTTCTRGPKNCPTTDGGDSPSPTPEPCEGKCENEGYKGDKMCDDGNNNCGCEYDGGDCCGEAVVKDYCSSCECLDPHASRKPKPEPKTTTITKAPCLGSCENEGYKGDKWCDDGNNNCGCEYDGGDCCGPEVKKNYCTVCACKE